MSTIANTISSAHAPASLQSLFPDPPLSKEQQAAQAVSSSSLLGSEHFDIDSMTPDALLVYLSGRMGSIDDQMSTIFDRQKNSEKVRTQLRGIEEALAGLPTDPNEQKDLSLTQKAYDQIEGCLQTIGEIDLELEKKLRADLAADGQVLSKGDLTYNTMQLKSSRDYLSMVGKDLEAGSQMDMITLQSLMGARQTAIQLSTNLISALNESQKSIVGNIR